MCMNKHRHLLQIFVLWLKLICLQAQHGMFKRGLEDIYDRTRLPILLDTRSFFSWQEFQKAAGKHLVDTASSTVDI